jgi:hypothetical protein
MANYPDDEWEEDDERPCPACGHHATRSQHCTDFGCDEGFVDAYEDDQINESPGTWVPCPVCCGHGIIIWCPKCGADYFHAKARKDKATA